MISEHPVLLNWIQQNKF
jgi:hypothetical protein